MGERSGGRRRRGVMRVNENFGLISNKYLFIFYLRLRTCFFC